MPTIVIPGTTMPWITAGGKNPSYNYGAGGGTNPILLASLSPGNILTITATGNVTPSSSDWPPNGPNGGSWISISGFNAEVFNHPSNYIPFSNIGICGLCGAFTDASGNVIVPVQIGSSCTLVVPPGAVQLQIGVNDIVGSFVDNSGSFSVSIVIGTMILNSLPIPMTMQTPYLDLRAPNNPKQFNALILDANPNGQVISPTLLFDDNNGNVSTVIPSPSTFTGSVRNKFTFQVNAGLGQQAYRISLKLDASVTVAPIVYQAEIYADILADIRASFDTYWLNLGTDETKICKQGYFDYTSTAAITVSLYADGATTAYYTFTLPANPVRSAVPMRVRFAPRLFRLVRLIAVSSSSFQMWSASLDVKPMMGGGNPGAKGYARQEVTSA